MNANFRKAAQKAGLHVEENVPLHTLSTFKIGGPAQFYVNIRSVRQLKQAVQLALQFNIPFKVLGNASNVLIADQGFDGLIIHNCAQTLKPLPWPKNLTPPDFPLYQGVAQPDVTRLTPVLVQAASGLRLPSLIVRLHRKGLIGLEWFAGIPATVGGALYMNAHGGPYFWGQFVWQATLFDGQQVNTVKARHLQLGYDFSRLQHTGEIVLNVSLMLWQGETKAARAFYKNWAQQKQRQPQISAGCIFRNLTREQQQRLGLPTPSVGYFIDKILGLKGLQHGKAIVSPAHAAFIENLGGASASDVLHLIEHIQNQALRKANIQLQLEIELIGFNKPETQR